MAGLGARHCILAATTRLVPRYQFRRNRSEVVYLAHWVRDRASETHPVARSHGVQLTLLLGAEHLDLNESESGVSQPDEDHRREIQSHDAKYCTGCGRPSCATWCRLDYRTVEYSHQTRIGIAL